MVKNTAEPRQDKVVSIRACLLDVSVDHLFHWLVQG